MFDLKDFRKIFFKRLCFYFLFELKKNFKAKRLLERNFYMDKVKERFFIKPTWSRSPNRVQKDFKKILIFSFLAQTRFAQFYLRKENTLF